MNFSMDYRGFAYLAVVSIGTGLLFGLAPALRLSKLDVNTSLREGGRGPGGVQRFDGRDRCAVRRTCGMPRISSLGVEEDSGGVFADGRG